MKDLRGSWNQRADRLGRSHRGVLFQGLPDHVNEAIHRWHVDLVARNVLAHVPQGGRILDLGCGYGRLAENVRSLRPDIDIVGLDFSQAYCEMFNRSRAGASVCADLRRLPFGNARFDAVLAVTVLMYVSVPEARAVVEAVRRVLVDGGVALFVDPSSESLNVARLLKKKGAGPIGPETPANGFSHGAYRALFKRDGMEIIGSGGNTSLTLFLPIMMATRHESAVRRLNRWAGLLAGVLDRSDRIAVHRWLAVRSTSTGA